MSVSCSGYTYNSSSFFCLTIPKQPAHKNNSNCVLQGPPVLDKASTVTVCVYTKPQNMEIMHLGLCELLFLFLSSDTFALLGGGCSYTYVHSKQKYTHIAKAVTQRMHNGEGQQECKEEGVSWRAFNVDTLHFFYVCVSSLLPCYAH